MRGMAVFYPVGWDDNGLATERRVQNCYRISCDPSLPYQPGLVPSHGQPGTTAAARVPVSRRNFIEFCRERTRLDEQAYEQAWRQLGLSVDWSTRYRTIEDRPAAVAQRAFLRALAAGDAYQALGPVLWDVTFRTAIAQAETEDREQAASCWRLAFGLVTDRKAGSPASQPEVVVVTTRPELLPACVALVAHPEDERYRGLVGSVVRTPLFNVAVPVLAHHLAEPAKGTGIAMVCTFGDLTDVTWWRDLALPARPVLGADGRLRAEPPGAVTDEAGRAAYAQLACLTARTARTKVTELLAAAGALRGQPEPVRHPVKFYENGDAPLEIITARQWYVANGSRDPRLRERLLSRGRELAWHPPHMRTRYENWVSGLTGDWLISRQRFFGVPIPVWYPLDASGAPVHDSPIWPADDALPVDPLADPPPGYQPEQRGQPGGFTGDPDVMDTWATSSLTPQIIGGWPEDADLFRRVFPMDLRPQAHEIIRTWLFYTVLRSQVLTGRLPWRHAAISGWILDPDRKKMSKSAGNTVTPAGLFSEYGADAVRYWAASARLGVDTAFDHAQLRIGRRLAIKMLNATRFVLGLAEPDTPHATVTAQLDLAMLRRLAQVAGRCTAALEGYDHASALESAEQFFWQFCDDYLELVKPRAYGAERDPQGAGSAVTALRCALSVLLRLLAPVLPFASEEAWSWFNPGSIHLAPWPSSVDPAEYAGAVASSASAITLAALQDDGAGLDAARAAIGAIRKAKSAAGLSQRTGVSLVVVRGPVSGLDALRGVMADVVAAGNVAMVELVTDGDDLRFDVML
jgi:valyl-tRNA synthetase